MNENTPIESLMVTGLIERRPVMKWLGVQWHLAVEVDTRK